MTRARLSSVSLPVKAAMGAAPGDMLSILNQEAEILRMES